MSQSALAENPDSCSCTLAHQATERRRYGEEARGKEGRESIKGRVGVREKEMIKEEVKDPKWSKNILFFVLVIFTRRLRCQL